MLNTILGSVSSPFVAPFDPTSISGCKLWLDAADTSTISLSGSAVTQWDDKSGNAYNFAQGTSGLRPLSGTRTQNGLNVIDFDGIDDCLATTAAKSAFNFINNTTATLFIVNKFDSTAGLNYLIGANVGSNGEIGIVYYSNTTNLVFWDGNGSGTLVYDISSAVNTTARLDSIKSDPANATAANRIKYALNTGSFAGSNTQTGTASGSDSTQNLAIGDSSPSGSSIPLNGFIGEVLIYNSILSGTDITNVQTYLLGKWGI